MFFSSCDSLFGDSLELKKQIEAPYVFDCENAIALHAMQGNRASSSGEGKSHMFSRVAAGTWAIFSSCHGDAHSKREFV